jgi:hypothetical protein
MSSNNFPVVVTLVGNSPSCVPYVVQIPLGATVAVPYVLDLQSVQAGYYIAGYYDRTPYTRDYLRGQPRVEGYPVSPEQAYTGYTITNHNVPQPSPPAGFAARQQDAAVIQTVDGAQYLTIDIVLVIKNLNFPGVTILFDPQDQDSQA